MDDERNKQTIRPGDRAPLTRVDIEAAWRSPGGRPHPSEEPTGPLTRAIVAEGRTIDDGRQRFAPGETVELPLSEVERLRELGFLT